MITKVYKETNKKREEWKASTQCWKDVKQKRATMITIQKYIHKWMTRHAYFKLLSVLLSNNVIGSDFW